jgi:hypothetical protein
MTTDRNLARALDLWLAEGHDEVNDHVLDLVEERIWKERQRPAWLLRRSPVMNRSLTYAVSVAAALVVAVVAWQLLRPGSGVGSPTSTPLAAPSATATGDGRVRMTEGPLAPGRYVTGITGVDIEFVVPSGADGWEGGDAAFLGVPPMVDPPGGVFLGFNSVSQVTVDPCLNHAAKSVGDTVADIAAVWSALPHAKIVGPTEITVSGFSGVRFELVIDDDLAECQVEGLGLYRAGGIVRVVGAGQQVELWAIDVAGTRLVVEASSFPGARASDLTVSDAILDSIELAPAG